MSKNIKLTSRYTVFVIYEDKSHYLSTYNVLWKNCHMKGEYIYQLNLVRRFNEFNEKYRAIKTSVLCTLSTVQNGDIHIHIYIIYSVCTIGLFKKENSDL